MSRGKLSGELANSMAVSRDFWHNFSMETITLRLDPQGRLVVPKALREWLGFTNKAELHAYAEPGRLVLETREAIIGRMREEARQVDPQRSMVDELLVDRRAEARREHRN